MPSASSSSSPLGDDPIIIEVSDTDDDGGGGVALSTKVAERIASSLTQEELDAICSKYGVPEQYSAVLPAGHQRACSPLPPGAICVNEHALEAGMRVPLHAFFCEVLAHFGVAPIQIAPNGWRAMAGFIVLSHKAGVAPSLPVFRHFFSLCGFRFKGWYYFRGKDVAGALFKGMPPSFAGWKEAFFFLKSPTPWPCRVKWGHELSKGSTVEPVLTKGEERVAKKLLDVHGEAVDIKTYLSESNLAAAMITGSSAKLPPPPPTTTMTPPPTTTMTPPPTTMMTPPPTRTTRSASAKGMDPSATQPQGQASGVTVKPEPGSDTSSLGKKMKVTDDAAKLGPSRPQPSTPLGHAHGLFPGVPPSPPGMSTQKSLKMHLSTGSAAKPPPPPLLSIRTNCTASTKGMDPQVYDMMKNLRAAKAAQAQAAVATVKSKLASDTLSSGKKRKVAEDSTKQGPSNLEPSMPLDHVHASFSGASPSLQGFSTQSSKITREHDPNPMPQNMAHKPDGGGTSNWESARQMLHNIVTPELEQTFSAAKPSDVIASSYITALQAANYASFSLGYALELEEKHVAREREVDALRQELSQAKAKLADAEKAAAEEVRSAAEVAVRQFQGSTEQVLRFADHALAGYERGMDDMKRVVLRKYPNLDPEELVLPIDGSGEQ